jgi:hypothetical protein
MAIIIEVVTPSGRLLDRQRFEQNYITVGRAYDNQLILSDTSIDPHHLSINITDNGIIVNDMDSINGVRLNHQLLAKNHNIKSGDELIVGKTHIRVFAHNHSVPEAVNLSGQDRLVNYFSNGWLALSLLLLLSSFIILEIWTASIDEFRLRDYVEPVFIIDFFVIAYALFWGVIGKLIKHYMSFRAQFCLIAIYLIVTYCLDFFYGVLLFNMLNFMLVTIIATTLDIIVLAALLWLNLDISTYLNDKKKLVVSLLISFGLILLTMYTEVIDRTEFSAAPYLVEKILPPVFRIASGENIDEFVKDSQDIYSHEPESD